MRRDEERISKVVEFFLQSRNITQRFSVAHPPDEDVYLVRFENSDLPDVEVKIPLDNDVEESLPRRLEAAFRHVT